MKIKNSDLIGFFCKECKTHTTKTFKYVKRRIKEEKANFYCSRKCADSAHSSKMRGKGNPNFNGTFHGLLPSQWSEEKRKQASLKLSATLKAKETFVGENNPKWAGGKKPYDCVICGTTKEYPPHISQAILSGDRAPTCSVICSTAFSRRSIKTEGTSIEVRMREELNLRGISFEEQYNLNDKFRLDFFLPKYNIVIECDGDYWHNLPEAIRRDKRKNAYVKACGFSMYRFWEREINADVEACVDVVMTEINERRAIK